MSTARIPAAGQSCPSCGAGLDALVVGGVGDWRTKILCSSCLEVWMSPPGHITTLVALQYGISEAAARWADAKSQEEFEQVVLGGPVFDDLPEALNTARWHARRLAARQS